MALLQTTEAELHKHCSAKQIKACRKEKANLCDTSSLPARPHFLSDCKMLSRLENAVYEFIEDEQLSSDVAERIKERVEDALAEDSAENVIAQLDWYLSDSLAWILDDKPKTFDDTSHPYGEQLADGFEIMRDDEG